MTKSTKSPTEITPINIFNDQTLYDIGSFADAMVALEQAGVTPVTTQELGNGFGRTDNKTQFVGVPLVLIQWEFRTGDQSPEYVEVILCTKDSARYTITDGGAGIYTQLRAFTDRTGRQNGILAENGFTSSDYRVCGDCRKTNNSKATLCRHCGSSELGWGETFYIAE